MRTLSNAPATLLALDEALSDRISAEASLAVRSDGRSHCIVVPPQNASRSLLAENSTNRRYSKPPPGSRIRCPTNCSLPPCERTEPSQSNTGDEKANYSCCVLRCDGVTFSTVSTAATLFSIVAWVTIREVKIICGANGHAYAARAQQADGAHTKQGYKTGTPREENRSLVRIQIPTTRFGPPGKARSRFPEAQKGHLRSWMLLASSPWVRPCQTPKIKAALLGSEIDGEPPS